MLSALSRGGELNSGRLHAPRPPAWHCQGLRSPLGASGTDPQMLCSDPKRRFYFLSEKTSSVLRKHRQGDQTQAGLLRCRLLRTGVSHVPAGEVDVLEPFPLRVRVGAARPRVRVRPGHPPLEGHVQSVNRSHPAGLGRCTLRPHRSPAGASGDDRSSCYRNGRLQAGLAAASGTDVFCRNLPHFCNPIHSYVPPEERLTWSIMSPCFHV